MTSNPASTTSSIPYPSSLLQTTDSAPSSPTNTLLSVNTPSKSNASNRIPDASTKCFSYSMVYFYILCHVYYVEDYISVGKQKVRGLVGDDLYLLVAHGKNYVASNFLVKLAAVLALPVFTRLIDPSGYGLVAVYTSIVGLLSIFFILGFNNTLLRYYYEDKKDFKGFLASNITFITSLNILLCALILWNTRTLADFLGVPGHIVTYGVFTGVVVVFFRIYLSLLQTRKESRLHAVSNSIYFLSITVSSLLLVLSLKDDPYLGKIYGNLWVSIAAGAFGLAMLFRQSDFGMVDTRHISYSLRFGLPLVPAALSQLVLVVFDQVMINKYVDSASTGLYSFGYQVGSLILMVVSGLNLAWVAYFYDYSRDKQYERIEALAQRYVKIILFSALGLIFFSRELVVLLADPKYYPSLDIVPVIILAQVFSFKANMYRHYSTFHKKTVLVSINTVIAALSNIGLNYLLIPVYGYRVAAATTFASYLLLFVLNYLAARLVIKATTISVRRLFQSMTPFTFFMLAYVLVQIISESYLLVLSVKTLLLAGLTLTYFHRDLRKILWNRN
ncbi:oligosaccharide flippase family protein [Candidatus Uhrbacteria bacterium]|nr:oligosaccharide flippase family protein [Candidatus Uhrbacteria bacterium]